MPCYVGQVVCLLHSIADRVVSTQVLTPLLVDKDRYYKSQETEISTHGKD